VVSLDGREASAAVCKMFLCRCEALLTGLTLSTSSPTLSTWHDEGKDKDISRPTFRGSGHASKQDTHDTAALVSEDRGEDALGVLAGESVGVAGSTGRRVGRRPARGSAAAAGRGDGAASRETHVWQRPVLERTENAPANQFVRSACGRRGRGKGARTHKRILMRTSPFLGGATSTSSIDSGLAASQAIAAGRGGQRRQARSAERALETFEEGGLGTDPCR